MNVFLNVFLIVCLCIAVTTMMILRAKISSFEKNIKAQPEKVNNNPNKLRSDMRCDVINGGLKMFRNPDTYWNTSDRVEKWHGPMCCWGVDFNNLVYNTNCGNYTIVRDLTTEEMERLSVDVIRTPNLPKMIEAIL